MKQFLRVYSWPLICGVLVAALVLNYDPMNWLPGKPDQQNFDDLQVNRGLQEPISFAAAVTRASPSVVNIYTTKSVDITRQRLLNDPFLRRFFGGQLQPQRRMETSLGSGVIVSEQGYILTALHVIDNADKILVLLADGTESKAKVVGIDQDTDLAVLYVDINDLPAIPIGDPGSIRVGDIVLAIGNPFGIGQTVTQGIISGTERTVLGLDSVEQFIQTDAAINPGNSGGALIDVYGNLLGINANIVSGEKSGYSIGVGFATPADAAIKVVEDIVKYGEVRRGWLGFSGDFVSPTNLAQLTEGFYSGLRITVMDPQGPAFRAGLEVGDVIVRIDSVNVINVSQVRKLIVDAPAGTYLNLEVLRDGNIIPVVTQTIAKPK